LDPYRTGACHTVSLTLFRYTDTTTTQISTLSLHDALPISHNPITNVRALMENSRTLITSSRPLSNAEPLRQWRVRQEWPPIRSLDRKSTRLNSSHVAISYAVFCLKKRNSRNSGRAAAARRC